MKREFGDLGPELSLAVLGTHIKCPCKRDKTCVDHSNKERQQYEWFILPDQGKVAEFSSELRVHLTSYCLERSPLKEARVRATPAE